jgi:hypothetical protein
MPDIEYAFLADAADARPGEKFNILGGGVSRIGGHGFPLVHPHLALVVGLVVTSTEVGKDHEIRFVLLGPDGTEVADGTGSIRAEGPGDGGDQVVTFAVDFWNLAFPAPGTYSFRILVGGSERKRLPLVVAGVFPPVEAPGQDAAGPRRLDA